MLQMQFYYILKRKYVTRILVKNSDGGLLWFLFTNIIYLGLLYENYLAKLREDAIYFNEEAYDLNIRGFRNNTACI